ncbi:lipocalin-15 [Bos mutus]|uniref:lipocalin-15 n=1 Tax=Bos mutus TaxID=72004 RepID=UPI0038B5FCCF
MGATLLSCVLLLLWPPSAQADVLVQPDFDANKFSGLWYVVSMVSDCKVFLGKKDHLLMSTRDIKASAGGNLSVHMEFPRADGCNRADAEYLRVGAQGHFRVPALGYLDVRVVDTDYSSFAVVYIYKELEGALSTMVQLYSRTQEASPQALEAFQDFYPTVGLPADMVAMLPKSGTPESPAPVKPLACPEHGALPWDSRVLILSQGPHKAEFAQGCAGGIGLLQLSVGLNDAAQVPAPSLFEPRSSGLSGCSTSQGGGEALGTVAGSLGSPPECPWMDPRARAESLLGALSAHKETEAQKGQQLAQPVARLGSCGRALGPELPAEPQ